MKVKIYRDRFIETENIIGSQYENLATTLEFEFPEKIEKNGIEIPISELNKYIVFDIEGPNNQDLIIDNKYSIPYDIAKLGDITFIIKLEEKSDNENVTDKLIWNSQKITIPFNKSLQGITEITPEKLDAFNTAVTELNETTSEAKELINTVETKLENGEFDGKDGIDGTNGQDYVLTDTDKTEIASITKPLVEQAIEPTLNNNLQESKDYTDNAITRDFKDISFNESTMTFMFTRHDNTTFTVDLPIESTVKNGRYDEITQELVLVLVSDQEIRIPASGLIDDYDGVDTATIQCSVSADNKISCNIISGSISKTLLTAELQAELNDKVNTETLNSKINEVKELIPDETEEWTFTLEDGTTVTKKVVLG